MWQVAAGLVAGVCLALVVPASLAASIVVTAAGLVLALAAVLRWAPLAAAALGVLLGLWQLQAQLADRLPVELENQPIRIVGTVVSVPQGTPAHPEVSLRATPDGWANRAASPARTDLVRRAIARAGGRRPRTRVKLRRPRGFSNPGGQDNEARMLRDGVGASGYVRAGHRLGRREGSVMAVSGAACARGSCRLDPSRTRRASCRRHRRRTRGRPAGCGQPRRNGSSCPAAAPVT